MLRISAYEAAFFLKNRQLYKYRIRILKLLKFTEQSDKHYYTWRCRWKWQPKIRTLVRKQMPPSKRANYMYYTLLLTIKHWNKIDANKLLFSSFLKSLIRQEQCLSLWGQIFIMETGHFHLIQQSHNRHACKLIKDKRYTIPWREYLTNVCEPCQSKWQ